MKKLPPEIRILPENVANKIAAGEVVERPAAVVKELLENAIDAGATRITVEFKHGGKTFVKVSDDGCGMTREQALMSLEPHATSKIRQPEDIFKISSYGFRGEAVPSIASVSVFSIKTRPEAQPMGTEILVRSGTVESVKDCGMACGTEIVVENIFCSVPARRKFLKSDNVEASHIVKLCRLYALALPEISITLIENARVIFRSEKNLGVVERIKRIFGAESSAQLVPLKRAESGQMAVSGAILEPGASFPTSRNICAFINSRPVDCKAVFSAIKEAYSGIVPKGRFAAAFLFIELPFENVDVNVHPAKREVRLRDEFAVRDFLFSTISKRLAEFTGAGVFGRRGDDGNGCDIGNDGDGAVEGAAGARSGAAVGKVAAPLRPLFSPADTDEDGLSAASVRGVTKGCASEMGACAQTVSAQTPRIKTIAVRPVFKPSIADNADAVAESAEVQFEAESDDDISQALPLLSGFSDVAGGGVDARTADLFEAPNGENSGAGGSVEDCRCGGESSANAENGENGGVSTMFARWRYLGCIGRKFALFETSAGLEILNVLGALRRVGYARIIENLRSLSPVSQMLLIPVNLKFERADAEVFAENFDTFKACGFDIEEFGKNFYRITAAPDWIQFERVEQFIRDFVEVVREESKSVRAKKLSDAAFADAAVSKLSTAGFVFDEKNLRALLDSLARCPSYATSPDGKPTIKEISHAALTRLF